MAKAAAIFVIALVLVAAVLLRPVPGDVERPVPLAARALVMHTVAVPGVPFPTAVLPAAVQSRLRTGSKSFPNRFRVHAEPVRRRFRVGSEWEHGSTRGGGTNAFTELRGSTPAGEPLTARRLVPTADGAPGVISGLPDPQRSGHLTRAFETAAHQTSGAFRTAGRALRSVF